MKRGLVLAAIGMLLLWVTGEELVRGFWLSPRDLGKWGLDASPHPREAGPWYASAGDLVFTAIPVLYIAGMVCILWGTARGWPKPGLLRKWRVAAALALFMGGALLSARALWCWYVIDADESGMFAAWWSLFGLDRVKTMILACLLGVAVCTLGVVIVWERILRGERGSA
jgi:hypothetical protein